MLSLQEIRKIHPELSELDDAQLESLRDALCVIVENVVEEYLETETQHGKQQPEPKN